MVVENCSAPGCNFATNDYPVANALEALRLHSRGAHPENFQNPNGGADGGAVGGEM